MKLPTFLSSKNAIILACIVLSAYLVLILGVINLGQTRLKISQQNELQLKGAHQAVLLSYFFSVSQNDIAVLSRDNTMASYFHSRSLGLPIQDELLNLSSLLQQTYLDKTFNGAHIFQRIALFNLDGSSVVNDNNNPFPFDTINSKKLTQEKQLIQVKKTENGMSIRLLQLVSLNEGAVAIIVAELSNQTLIKKLTAQEHLAHGSRLELRSAVDRLFIWDSLSATPHHETEQDQLFFFEEPIENTPFTLVGWHENPKKLGIFTSHRFVLMISLLAIPVIFGLYFLLRIEHNNTVLATEISLSNEQKQKLALYTYKLETEIGKRKISEKMLAHRAMHDSLTGLSNRSFCMKQLEHSIAMGRRNHTKVLLMYIDLDNFKQINDTLGHAVGDQVLIESSKRLVTSLRKTDTISRLGGDEFLLILPDLKNNQQAAMLAGKVLSLFEQPFMVVEDELFTSTSIGLSIYPQDGESSDTLLKCADMALYRVKDEGRNSFTFYDPEMNANVQRNVALNRRLRYAIEQNKLEMYYQPLVDLQTGKVLGAEALMRWTDEELGFVPPDEFILLAERNGLIHQLGDFALTEASQQVAKWQEITPLRIAVNFSSVQFRDGKKLFSKIITILEQTGLANDRLDIEVTESLLINQDQQLSEVLAELQRLGMQLSLDDFGTGYSALSYLQKYAFDKLKIDRAFVTHLNEKQADRSLVTAIIAMAKALDLKVVAEGIEDQGQADFLRELGCELGQGYLFSKPLPAQDFEKLLIADNS